MNQELLYKYFKGITSVEEEKMILDWIDASDENRDIFLKERMIRHFLVLGQAGKQ